MKKNNLNKKTAIKEDTKQNEIIRIQKKQNNFVMLDKGFIDDDRLSFKAKGILTYLLSKPDNWKVIVKDLINHSADGKAAIYSGLKELQKHGYYKKSPVRENGVIARWESVVYECPKDCPIEEKNPKEASTQKKSPKSPISPLLTDFQDIDNLNIENQNIENRQRNNININKNTIYNKDISINQSEEKIEMSVDQPTTAPPIDTIDTPDKIINVLTKAELADKISIDELKDKYSANIDDIEIIFDIIADVLTVESPITPTLRISKQNIPFINVKTELLKLESKHIEYVLHSLNHNDNKYKINKNLKSYLMTSLFHAPRTINHFSNNYFSPKPEKNSEYDVEELLKRSIRKSLNF